MKTKINVYLKGMIAAIITGIFISTNLIAANAEKSSASMTIVEVASKDARFSILVEAVVKAELADALSAEGPYTVFAPTNDAFKALFSELGVDGIEDISKETLTPILLYHVVDGKVMAADVSTGMVPTLNENAKLDVMASKSGVTINKSTNVIITDIESSNGVIHVIDKVMVPETKTASKSSGSCN
jgi:transforming growth factor-beta-induced protein